MTESLSWQPSLFDGAQGYSIRAIGAKDTYYFLLNIHYARRIPSISHAYGLFLDGELVGVITYGVPPSPTLCEGICGVEYKSMVLELNRLCLLHNRPNEASRLVAGSFKLLPQPSIIVSFADTAQDHLGVVYQATNFLYTGLSAKRKEWAVRGMENLHSKTLSNMARDHGDGREIDNIREMFGDDFYYRERSRKHRYIMLIGNRTQRRDLRRALRYEVLPYPKEGTHD